MKKLVAMYVILRLHILSLRALLVFQETSNPGAFLSRLLLPSLSSFSSPAFPSLPRAKGWSPSVRG